MLTLLILVPIVLVAIVLRVVFRMVTLPMRLGRRRGFGDGGGLGYRRHHHHRFGGLGTIVALFALDRLFGNRRW